MGDKSLKNQLSGPYAKSVCTLNGTLFPRGFIPVIASKAILIDLCPILTFLTNSLRQPRFAQRFIEVSVVFGVLERGERSRSP